MEFLTAAVVLVGVLCLLDLLLTFAVIRRLREHADRLPKTGAGTTLPDTGELVGRPLPEFSVTTVDGCAFNRAMLTRQPCLVGFFSVGCTPCHEQAPEFAALTGSGQPAFAFVASPDKEVGDLAGLLAGADAVVVELPMHGLGSQLGVAGYPTYVSVDETGMVTRAAMSLHQLTAPVRG